MAPLIWLPLSELLFVQGPIDGLVVYGNQASKMHEEVALIVKKRVAPLRVSEGEGREGAGGFRGFSVTPETTSSKPGKQ